VNIVRVSGEEQKLESDGANLKELRLKVEPWLAAIFQAERLNLLVGSGFSTAIAHLCEADAVSMKCSDTFGDLQARIDAQGKKHAESAGRGSDPNLEDQLTAALELAVGLQILGDQRAEQVAAAIGAILDDLAAAVLRTESAIREFAARDTPEAAIARRTLQAFLLSFASRAAPRERLSIFTTNYDRVLEWGCDIAGVRVIDRFVGYVEPRFRTTRLDIDIHYSPPGIRGEPRYLEGVIRFAKLHGSIDWAMEGHEIVRIPLSFGSAWPGGEKDAYSRLMIFPNSAKDLETAVFPYAELFRDFASSVCRTNSALVTYGYGFGDDHVNRVLNDMLTIPSTHLVIISYDDPGDRIRRFIDGVGRPSQISLLVGPEVASLSPLVDSLLPKPAIDTITERERAILARRGDGREAKAEQAAAFGLETDQ